MAKGKLSTIDLGSSIDETKFGEASLATVSGSLEINTGHEISLDLKNDHKIDDGLSLFYGAVTTASPSYGSLTFSGDESQILGTINLESSSKIEIAGGNVYGVHLNFVTPSCVTFRSNGSEKKQFKFDKVTLVPGAKLLIERDVSLFVDHLDNHGDAINLEGEGTLYLMAADGSYAPYHQE